MFEFKANWLFMFNEINYNAIYDVLGLYEAIYTYQGNNRKALYNSLQLTSLTNEYKKILWRMNSNMVFGKINNLTLNAQQHCNLKR